MSLNFDKVSEAVVEGMKIDAFQDEMSRRAADLWVEGIQDRHLAEFITHSVESRKKKLALGQVFPFRCARFNGGIFLGDDLASPLTQPRSIFLRKNDFKTHLLTAATTGAGKSTKQAHISRELTRAGTSTWQISCEKDDLRGQLPRFSEQGLPLIVLRLCDLKLNPLDAGTNEPRAHLNSFISRFQRMQEMSLRSSIIFHAVCHGLYRDFGIFSGQRSRFPTLFHAYENIRILRNENVAARDALLARLGEFLETYTPKCGAWLKGWTPTDLATFSIAFSFFGGSGGLKHFLVESLIDHVFQDAVEHGALNRDLHLFVFIDDGQRLATSQGNTGMTGLSGAAAVLRSSGIGLGFLIHTTHGVSPYLLADMNMRFLGQMANPDDWAAMGRSLSLTPEQLQCVKASQGPGRFAGIVTTGQWHEPFLFEVPPMHFDPGVTDADVAASQRPLDALPVEFAENFRHWERYPVVELQGTSFPSAPSFSPAAQRLLVAVVAKPGQAVGQYARALAMNGKVLRAAREHLVQIGLLCEHKLQLNPKGKPAIVLEPLPAAFAALGQTPPIA